MAKIYFDSSAYVKYFKKEKGSYETRKIIDYVEKNNNIQIIMSVWVINETIAAIDKKAYSSHEILEDEARKIISRVLQKTLEYSKNHSNIIFYSSR